MLHRSLVIETLHLRLVPHSPAHLIALIEGVRQYEQQTGLTAAEGLRDFFVSGDVSPDWIAGLSASAAADPWVHGFAVVHHDRQCVIGTVGFKGPPDGDKVVEIGYGIVPTQQNRGYATEATAALLDFAFADPRVGAVRAHTLPTPNASTQVLAKLGFDRIGEIVDPQDGPVWRWQKRREVL